MVIFRNPNLKYRGGKQVDVKGFDIDTDTQIFKIESEAPIEDLIDQQRSFFLPTAKDRTEIINIDQYIRERLSNWLGLTVIRSGRIYAGCLVIGRICQIAIDAQKKLSGQTDSRQKESLNTFKRSQGAGYPYSRNFTCLSISICQ